MPAPALTRDPLDVRIVPLTSLRRDPRNARHPGMAIEHWAKLSAEMSDVISSGDNS